ncbi:19192_t:CDS:1, partial [Gigaspora rosea]
LNLKGKYTFPITESGDLAVFIDEVWKNYRIPISLPKQYSDLNFMNKPDLPDTPERITEMDFQVPITTTEALVEVARELRKIYFFRQIPSEWIKISKIIPNPHETLNGTKLQLPKTIEDLKEIIDRYPLYQQITLPIIKYDNITETTEVLRTYFNFEDLPSYMFQLPNLPKYEWQIFNNDDNI